MFFLDQHSDQVVILRAKGHLLRVLSFDESIGGDSDILWLAPSWMRLQSPSISR
jgi:hypothetical protein